MKKIRFTTLEEQDDPSSYWKGKTMQERLAEGFRLTQKAYWEYYSQPNPPLA